MKRWGMAVVVMSLVAMAGVAGAAETYQMETAAPKTDEVPAAAYTCPMHPEIQATKPGACPTCGMALEPAKAPVAYVCPMCSDVRETKPGQCPHCGMTLEAQKA